MDIKNVDKRVKEEEKNNAGGNQKAHLEFTKGVPLQPPDTSHPNPRSYRDYDTSEKKDAGEKEFKLGLASNGKTHRRNPHIKGTPRKKKTLKNASTYKASCRSAWIRDDIWAAVKSYSEMGEGRTIRSIVEEALYNFLWEKGRVENPTLGQNEEESSWVKPN